MKDLKQLHNFTVCKRRSDADQGQHPRLSAETGHDSLLRAGGRGTVGREAKSDEFAAKPCKSSRQSGAHSSSSFSQAALQVSLLARVHICATLGRTGMII
jgi:hypothetical protein